MTNHGKVAFESFHKNYLQDHPLRITTPKFEDLHHEIQESWEECANAVIDSYNGVEK
jgi:hypothetical protein